MESNLSVVFFYKMNYHEGANKMKRKQRTIHYHLLLVTFCLILFAILPTAFADEVSNGNYSIDVDNIGTNPQPTQTPIIPTPQVLGTKTVSAFTTGPNYTVTTSNDPFTFTLSQNTIDYGILSSTNPVIRTSGITFSNPRAGAEVIANENHPLIFAPNNVIPNTSCDNGDCTTEIASLWENPLTYGFGYRCDSTQPEVCDQQFLTANYFEQYPDAASNQLPEIVLTDAPNSKITKATITYKVNISGTQKSGGYYNSITYLAIPNF